MLNTVATQAWLFLAEVPSFTSDKPPGGDKLLKIGGWVLYGISAICVLGIILIGGKMVIAHRRGEMEEHGKALGIAMFGCILVSAASGIAGALIT